MTAPPGSIIKQPELQVYLTDFGKKEDVGLVAEAGSKVVGAVWVRIMNDYGHIDDMTPSFAISLYKEYRGIGIGTALMKEMLCILKQRGYKQISLAVQKANYAVEMYKKVGFVISIVIIESHAQVVWKATRENQSIAGNARLKIAWQSGRLHIVLNALNIPISRYSGWKKVIISATMPVWWETAKG